MTRRIYTDAEKLDVIEDILDEVRDSDAGTWSPTAEDEAVLKAICTDLRAHTPGAPNRVLDALSFQVDSATKAKAQLGYMEVGHMRAVAEALIAHWSVVRSALEQQGERR